MNMAQDLNLKWILHCTIRRERILHSIHSIRDENTNLKYIIIKKLKEDNKRLRTRCSNLEKLCSLVTSTNALEQFSSE